ncbi:MAG: thioesterase family protein [Pseudomonadota bacterium]
MTAADTPRFASATAHRATATPGRFEADIAPGWDVAGNTNGGYLMALAAGVMRTHSERSDPVTLTAHYLRPVQPGTVQIDCETIKQGKAFGTVRATLSRDDKALVTLLGAFGTLGAAGAQALKVDAAPPELPPVEACDQREAFEFAPPLHHQVDMRLHPEDAGFAIGNPTGNATMRGWFRLKDGEPLSTQALLLALDAFPPTVFNARLPVAWTPTVELTAHLRAQPAPGWLRARFSTRFVTGGFLEEDGELWDDTGALVAQSRQLALVPQSA